MGVCQKYCDNSDYPTIQASSLCGNQAIGKDPCTWGPSYWCESKENADECNIENAAETCEKYCKNTNDYPTLVNSDICEDHHNNMGSNPCTWGPSYFCASEENAKKCNLENPDKEC